MASTSNDPAYAPPSSSGTTTKAAYELSVYHTLSDTIFGAIIWDLLLCLPAEIKYVFIPDVKKLFRRNRNRRKYPSVVSFLLLNSRLLAIPIITTTKLLNVGQVSSCHATLQAFSILYAFAALNGTAVFIIRTIAIRSSKWPLKVALWTIWSSSAVAGFYWGTRLKIKQAARTSAYAPSCQQVTNVPSWTWGVYLYLVFFDLLILVLILQSQVKNRGDFKNLSSLFWKKGSSSNLVQRFFVDTVLYFLLSFSITLMEVIWTYHYRHDAGYIIFLVPVHIWLTVIIAPRVIRNLKLHSAQAHMTTYSVRITDQGGREIGGNSRQEEGSQIAFPPTASSSPFSSDGKELPTSQSNSPSTYLTPLPIVNTTVEVTPSLDDPYHLPTLTNHQSSFLPRI